MTFPIVTETAVPMEPVVHDPFIDDVPEPETRVLPSPSPAVLRRRILD